MNDVDKTKQEIDLQQRIAMHEEQLANGEFVELEDDELEHFNLDAFQEVDAIESTEYGLYCIKTNSKREGV